VTGGPTGLGMRPPNPDAVQVAMPIRPPGRHTRTISSAACWWCGANMTPTQDSTVSKLGSCGRPCQYLELDIWDEHGTPVPAGERGEVVLRGPKVFKGYWRDPDATSAAFAGSWFHTGDIGVLEDGFLKITDRKKDLIKTSGGKYVAPQNLENLMQALGISKGSASMTVRQLEQWGALKQVWIKGERKDYYETTESFGRIIRKALLDLVGRRMESSDAILDEAERLLQQKKPVSPTGNSPANLPNPAVSL